MEIDNVIFQHLESFGKTQNNNSYFENILKIAIEEFWIFVLENYKKFPKIDVPLFIFSMYNVDYNPPKTFITCSIKNNIFPFLFGFKVQTKMCLMVLEIW